MSAPEPVELDGLGIPDLYTLLAVGQKMQAESEAKLKAAIAEAEKQLAPLRLKLKEAERRNSIINAELKTAVLALAEDEQARPELPPGVVLSRVTKLAYDEEDAVRWAMDDARPELLSIRRGPVLELAKSMAEPPPFARWETEPIVAISKDLDKAFAEATGERPRKPTMEDFLPAALEGSMFAPAEED